MGVESGYYDEWCISSNPLSSATDREHTITSTAKLIQELAGTTWLLLQVPSAHQLWFLLLSYRILLLNVTGDFRLPVTHSGSIATSSC